MTHREFVDSNQVVWTVWDVRCRGSIPDRRVRPELAFGWVAFQCRGERRRLFPIPEAWETLSDAELERLCAMADITPDRRSRGIAPQD